MKVDGCGDLSYYEGGYKAMGAALEASGRDMVYSCSWPAYIGSNESVKPFRSEWVYKCKALSCIGCGFVVQHPWSLILDSLSPQHPPPVSLLPRPHPSPPGSEMIMDGCNLWRNWDDIQCDWDSLSSIIDYWGNWGSVLAPYAGPGHWHDMDMLLIGANCVTEAEERTQVL